MEVHHPTKIHITKPVLRPPGGIHKPSQQSYFIAAGICEGSAQIVKATNGGQSHHRPMRFL